MFCVKAVMTNQQFEKDFWQAKYLHKKNTTDV